MFDARANAVGPRPLLAWMALLIAAPALGASASDMDMAMSGRLGEYSMMRDATGTAWQPDSSLMAGLHGQSAGWSTMLHGYVYGIADQQGGPRGDRLIFSESMLMAAAQRDAGGAKLTLRTMLSLDPLMGKRGYPLLFQTGESADGTTPLLDRQHPHDLIMELAILASTPLAARSSVFVYAGYPGEPALGPPTFMHRYSALTNPEAPIGHHWLDSTHISYGVFTGGVVVGQWKAEASAFNGREPDQFRWNFDPLRLDSWSSRVSWNPLASLALQLSYGSVHAPEALEPEINVRRYTLSAVFDRQLPPGHWQTTFAWGRNRQSPGTSSDAWLLESALNHGRHNLFARAEGAWKNELLSSGPLLGQTFAVNKLSIGYFYELDLAVHVGLGFGALLSAYSLPASLQSEYGAQPHSYMLFTRLNLQ